MGSNVRCRQKLEPVAEGVVGVAAAHAGESVIPEQRVPGGLEPCGERIQVRNAEGRVGFLGRPKVFFNPEVKLEGTSKPAAAAVGQGRRLGYLAQAQEANVEGSSLGLTAYRHGELQVVEGDERHQPSVWRYAT